MDAVSSVADMVPFKEIERSKDDLDLGGERHLWGLHDRNVNK